MLNEFINQKAAMKKLQFGVEKCVKLHVGKNCSESLCPQLTVDEWKLDLTADNTNPNVLYQKERFAGPAVMCQKEEQLYLGDLISADGRQDKNIDRRKKKGIGSIIQIMDILKTTYFGKYYFEAALILRSSLLLSSILLNSEAWINLSNKNIRALEQIDEMLLNKILSCQSKTSNTLKYLELRIQPIRF